MEPVSHGRMLELCNWTSLSANNQSSARREPFPTQIAVSKQLKNVKSAACGGTSSSVQAGGGSIMGRTEPGGETALPHASPFKSV